MSRKSATNRISFASLSTLIEPNIPRRYARASSMSELGSAVPAPPPWCGEHPRRHRPSWKTLLRRFVALLPSALHPLEE